MKKLLPAIICCLFLMSCQAQKEKVSQVCFEKKCFTVELARTQEEWQKGLMFREQMDQDKGMLFIFDENTRHRFWMKNTYIPLDIIWMDYARRVIHIEKSVPPCKEEPCPLYGPEDDSIYILEINANAAAKNNIKKDDILQFKIAL